MQDGAARRPALAPVSSEEAEGPLGAVRPGPGRVLVLHGQATAMGIMSWLRGTSFPAFPASPALSLAEGYVLLLQKSPPQTERTPQGVPGDGSSERRVSQACVPCTFWMFTNPGERFAKKT